MFSFNQISKQKGTQGSPVSVTTVCWPSQVQALAGPIQANSLYILWELVQSLSEAHAFGHNSRYTMCVEDVLNSRGEPPTTLAKIQID